MKKYATMILHRITSMFGRSLTEEDQVWEEWLSLEKRPRTLRDLTDLIHSDVRDEFKSRAITILLAPAIRFVPFKWNKDPHHKPSFFLQMVDLRRLSEKLVRFTAELICNNIDLVKDQMNDEEGLRKTGNDLWYAEMKQKNSENTS